MEMFRKEFLEPSLEKEAYNSHQVDIK